jgi:hypothetical protein
MAHPTSNTGTYAVILLRRAVQSIHRHGPVYHAVSIDELADDAP